MFSLSVHQTRPNEIALAGQHPFVHFFDLRMTGESGEANPLRAVSPFRWDWLDTYPSGIAYDRDGNLLATYQNEDVYLFSSDALKNEGVRQEGITFSERESQIDDAEQGSVYLLRFPDEHQEDVPSSGTATIPGTLSAAVNDD